MDLWTDLVTVISDFLFLF